MNLTNVRRIFGPEFEPNREIDFVWLAGEAAKHKKIVEIGAFSGRTTRVLTDNTTGQVISVDDWTGGTDEECKRIIAEHPVYEEFLANTKDCKNLQVLKMSSLDAAAALEGKTFDLIFIDASHDYESVKADILAWLPLLAPGGLLCGDDIGFPGVVKAVNELLPGNSRVAGSFWSWYGK